MSAEAQEKVYRLDGLKWLIALGLIAGAVWANWYFSAESVLYRTAGFLVVAVVAVMVAVQTRRGRNFWDLIVSARTEWKRVVWPTKQERNQTTMIVVAVVFVMALILWGLDGLFGWLFGMVLA